jgi:hypothetical protein
VAIDVHLPEAIDVAPAIEAAHPWVRRLLRLGFVARGVLYSLLGLLTLWSIARNGGKARGGMTTTFESIHAVGPGFILLVGLALGFAGFAIGMMWTAIFDWNLEGKSKVALAKRAGSFINGLVHVSLTASTVYLIAGHQAAAHSERRWTELALRYPLGREGVIAGGLYAIGFGVFLLSKIVTGKLDPLLDLNAVLPTQLANVASWIGRFGMLARGVIYVTIGVVLAYAGWSKDASNVVGIGGAMHQVSRNTFGAVSLALIAAGVFAYGLLMFVEARYRTFGERASKRFSIRF